MYRRYRLLILLAFSTLFTLVLSCKKEAEVPLYGNLTGNVKDAKTSTAIEGAVVNIINGTETRSVTTQSNGSFSFSKLDPGTVQLKVTLDKYEIYTQNVTILAGENSPVAVALQPKLAQLNISPNTTDFVGVEASKVIYLKNATGSGTVNFTVKPNENWMTVNPSSGTVKDNQTVTLTITVDRKGLAFGNYTGSMVFNADNNSIIYNVTMQVPNPNAPSVTTNDPTNITQSSAEIIGNLTNLGGGSVTQRGHCWSENSNPTIADTKTQLGAGLVGAFSSSITGLAQNKTYYVRAYAVNSAGTAYSETKTFTTSNQPTPPAVSNGLVSDIAATTAKITGLLTNIGGSNVTDYGHCWSENPSPTTANSKTQFGASNAAQTITSSLTNLKQGAKYYVRMYATNAVGTAYSNEVSFETVVPVVAPSLVTGAPANVGQTAAQVNANVSTLGSSPIIQHGFCWSTTSDAPTIDDNKVQKGVLSATGNFNATLSLQKGTSYFVRPYVQTQAGKTYYGGTSDVVTTEAGMVLYYPFNGETNDASGNGNNGSGGGGAKLSVDRNNNLDRAINLGKGFLGVNAAKLGHLSNETTMCFWTKISQSNFSGNIKMLLSQTSNDCFFAGGSGFALYIDPSTNSRVNFAISDAYPKKPYTTTVYEQASVVGDWHHIAMVKNGTTFKFFLDGILVKVITSPYSNAGSYDACCNQYNFRFGSAWFCPFNYDPFEALIDDFRIYTYALSDAEVLNVSKR